MYNEGSGRRIKEGKNELIRLCDMKEIKEE